MSDAVDGLAPFQSSGAMYSGVPATSPDRIARSVAPGLRARPKSVITARVSPSASRVRITLLLFRSPWITCFRCASASPEHSCCPILSASSGGSLPFFNLACSVSPSRNSIVRYSTSPRSASVVWIS